MPGSKLPAPRLVLFKMAGLGVLQNNFCPVKLHLGVAQKAGGFWSMFPVSRVSHSHGPSALPSWCSTKVLPWPAVKLMAFTRTQHGLPFTYPVLASFWERVPSFLGTPPSNFATLMFSASNIPQKSLWESGQLFGFPWLVAWSSGFWRLDLFLLKQMDGEHTLLVANPWYGGLPEYKVH